MALVLLQPAVAHATQNNKLGFITYMYLLLFTHVQKFYPLLCTFSHPVWCFIHRLLCVRWCQPRKISGYGTSQIHNTGSPVCSRIHCSSVSVYGQTLLIFWCEYCLSSIHSSLSILVRSIPGYIVRMLTPFWYEQSSVLSSKCNGVVASTRREVNATDPSDLELGTWTNSTIFRCECQLSNLKIVSDQN